jgi:hypothetical protein
LMCSDVDYDTNDEIATAQQLPTNLEVYSCASQ